MDRVKQVVNKFQDKFNILLFAGAGIAAFNTLARPDYNLIIFLYVYYVWNNMNDSKEIQSSEKISCFFVLIYSLFVDIFWCLFWGSKWGVKNDYESTIHSLVLFSSWAAILLKAVVLIFIGVIEWTSIKASLPAKLQEKLTGNYEEQRDEVGA